jgi:hypothetical protein
MAYIFLVPPYSNIQGCQTQSGATLNTAPQIGSEMNRPRPRYEQSANLLLAAEDIQLLLDLIACVDMRCIENDTIFCFGSNEEVYAT